MFLFQCARQSFNLTKRQGKTQMSRRTRTNESNNEPSAVDSDDDDDDDYDDAKPKEWAASQVLDGIALCRIASQELSARPKILYVHTYSPSRTVPHTLTQRCVAIKEMPHHCDNTFAPLARAGVGPKARAHRSPASLLPSSLSSSAVFVLSVAHGHIPHKADTETEHWSRSWS